MEAERYVDDLVHATRMVSAHVKRRLGLDTDVHRDFDYTDYEAVEQFAQEVAALLDRAPHAASA